MTDNNEIEDIESSGEQSFQRIKPSPFVVMSTPPESSQRGDGNEDGSKTPPNRTPTRPIPPAPLKRKFNASASVGGGGTARDDDDDDNAIDEVRGALAELLPASAVRRTGGSGDTVPATPNRAELLQPPTVVNTPQKNAVENAQWRRMRRYAKLATREARVAEAQKLVPSLAQSELSRGVLNVVSLFNLPTSEEITTQMLNAPFADSAVWRDAFRQAFPRFVSEFAGDMLPDFYNVDVSEYDAVRRWRLAQLRSLQTTGDDDDNNRNSSETSLPREEPPHGTWQQWRHYFLLVDTLFSQMMHLTVVALRKAPRGEWREFYCRSYNDFTCERVVERPEEAIFVAPEQFGVVGDVYDLALSVLDPMAPLPQLSLTSVPPWPAERFSIVRWYDAVLWEEYSKKYTDVEGGTATREEMFARRNHSTLDQLRFFVRMAPDQFLRSRFILKTGVGYQWAGYGNQLDEIMLDSMSWEDIAQQSNQLREQKRRLETVLSTEMRSLRVLARLINTRQQQQRRKRAKVSLGTTGEESTASDIVSEYVDDMQNNDDESVLQEQLATTRVRAQQHVDAIEAIDNQLQALRVMLNEKTDRVVQIAVYETSAVNEPSVQVPLKAKDFALVKLPPPSTVQRSLSLSFNEQQSIREIEFSESEDELATAAATTTTTPNALRPQHATLFDPRTHNRRIIYQAKINVALTHTLRFYTGWIGTDNGMFPKPFWLEYMQRLEHTRFARESLFSSEHVANFIIWLMQKHVELRDNGSMFRNYTQLPFSTQPDIEPDDEMLVPNSLTQTLVEENQTAVERIGELVQKKAFPYLLEYADAANADVDDAEDEESREV